MKVFMLVRNLVLKVRGCVVDTPQLLEASQSLEVGHVLNLSKGIFTTTISCRLCTSN